MTGQKIHARTELPGSESDKNWWPYQQTTWFVRNNNLNLVWRIFRWFFRYFHQRSTKKFAYTFGIWTRKKHDFLCPWKFSLFSPQQKCVANKRNKTSRLSASFCTKNHQNSFSSLRERFDWRWHTSSEKVPKPRMRVLVMYGRIYSTSTYTYAITWLKHAFSVLPLFWNLNGIIKQLVLED